MLSCSCTLLIRKKLFNSKVTQLRVAKDFAVAEKKLHLAISRRKYDPGKKASKRKLTSDVKTADPQPSTSKDESTSTQRPQAETVSEQRPEDAPIAEQQQEDETGLEQQTQDDSTSTQQTHNNSTSTLQSQDESIPKQQQHASDTLTSPSSEDSLPDYGSELKLFTTKDPHSIPKKPRYSSHPKPE